MPDKRRLMFLSPDVLGLAVARSWGDATSTKAAPPDGRPMRSHFALSVCVLMIACLTACSFDEGATEPESDRQGQSRSEATADKAPATMLPEEQDVEVAPDPAAGAPAVEDEPNQEMRLPAIREELRLLEKETEAAGAFIDRTRFDFDTVVQEVGDKPRDLFQWVRNNTTPLPYTGALKGAWGVLMERQGNTLDRSLLLAELLGRAGHNVKLANAELTTQGLARAEALLLESFDRRPPGPVDDQLDPAEETLVENLERVAELVGTTPEAAFEDFQRRAIAASDEMARLVSEANEQTAALMKKLPLERHPPIAQLAEALRSLKDHWWVVLQVGSETEAFDLFFDHEEMTAKELASLHDRQSTYPPRELPEDVYHTVTFRVVADRLTAEGVEESNVALAHTVRTDQSRLEPVWLAYIALGNRVRNAGVSSSSASDLRENLAKQDEWLPLLQIGSERIHQASIRADGTLNSEAKVPKGPLGGVLHGSKEMNEANQLVAVRLEIDLAGGGIENQESRVLFDYRDRFAAADASENKQKEKAEDSKREAMVSRMNELRAEFAAKEQACSEESGVAIEKLGVLKKGADTTTWDAMQLLQSLMDSDSCVALMTANPPPAPGEPTTYRLSRDLSNTTPNSSVFHEAVKVSRAAKFMTAQGFLILPFYVPEAYTQEKLRTLMLGHQGVLTSLAKKRIPFTLEAAQEAMSSSAPSTLQLLGFGLLRQQPTEGVAAAITQTNLVSQFSTMSLSASAIDIALGIDIVANKILPLSSNAEVGRTVSVRQGVFDTLLESYLIAGSEPTANTASVFGSDLDLNQGADWVAASLSEAPSAFSNLPHPDDQATTPMVVSSPVRVADNPSAAGYWLVDLGTGRTLGYSSDGRGQMIEMVIGIGIVLKNAWWAIELGKLVECISQFSAADRCGRVDCVVQGATSLFGFGVSHFFLGGGTLQLLQGELEEAFLGTYFSLVLEAYLESQEYLISEGCQSGDL